MARLSAFADEVTENFPGQVQYLTRQNVPCILASEKKQMKKHSRKV